MSRAVHQPGISERDWTEEFHATNGCYLNRCSECAAYFFGHKRRVVCRMCSTPTAPTGATSTGAEDDGK